MSLRVLAALTCVACVAMGHLISADEASNDTPCDGDARVLWRLLPSNETTAITKHFHRLYNAMLGAFPAIENASSSGASTTTPAPTTHDDHDEHDDHDHDHDHEHEEEDDSCNGDAITFDQVDTNHDQVCTFFASHAPNTRE
jgi:hypothetical protein